MDTLISETKLTHYRRIDTALYEFSELSSDYGFPFVCVGSTLKQLLKNRVVDNVLQFAIPESEIGVRGSERHKELTSFLTLNEMIQSPTIGNNRLLFSILGVQIEVKIIKNKYSFFNYPESYSYEPSEGGLFTFVLIPNPLEKYFKEKEIT